MGKKVSGSKRKRPYENEEVELENGDLEREIEALHALRAETEVDNSERSPSILTAYNRIGLVKALEDLRGAELPFIEVLELSLSSVGEVDDNEDLEREMAFYNHTLNAAIEGRRRLEDLGIPTRPPSDYFCEKVKTDAHMNRIKDRLILEEKKIDAFEKRKQRETNRKYEKQTADLRRKMSTSSGNSKSSALMSRSEDSGEVSVRSYPEKSKKRKSMDKKYGSGIKEKMKAKLTDKKSLNDMSDYNPRGGKLVRRQIASPKGGSRGGGTGGRRSGASPGGRGGRSGSKDNSKRNRPGEEARMKKRASPA